MSKTYKCTLNMEGYGKSKSAGKKKKVDEKEIKKKVGEKEGDQKEEDTAALELKSPKASSVNKDGGGQDEEEKKKKREDQSVRLFHDDTFKGLFQSYLTLLQKSQ